MVVITGQDEVSGRRERGFMPLPQLILATGAVLLGYLCWRLVAPFLPAICWALGLAIIVEPIHAWLLRKSRARNLAALLVILLVLGFVTGPGIVVVRALAAEASGILTRIPNDAATLKLREAIESAKVVGPIFRWLDARADLPNEAAQVARSIMAQGSVLVSTLLAGSMWLLTQLAITIFVLFFLLRDGPQIVSRLRPLIPFPAETLNIAFKRIAQTLRISLAAKFLVASIQGSLGGLMFFWLGLPAPVLWGVVMTFFSIFPVLGAFVIWVPAALMFAVQGDWRDALLLTGWGVLIIHPIDNLLGPFLVGTTLRLHPLLAFFAIIGGLAAFGASGIVLGPSLIAVTVVLFESKEKRAVST
jgi:predicted PurR-regulated permease PerM